MKTLVLVIMCLMLVGCGTAPVVEECEKPVELQDYTGKSGWNITEYDTDCSGECNTVVIYRPSVDSSGTQFLEPVANLPCDEYDSFVEEVKELEKLDKYDSDSNVLSPFLMLPSAT